MISSKSAPFALVTRSIIRTVVATSAAVRISAAGRVFPVVASAASISYVRLRSSNEMVCARG